ncbi:MAG TPA: radical SAM protein [Verrucomicrobiae bacterium]
MRIGLIAMSGVRVKSAELAALGVTLPGFVRRGKVIASLPSLGLLTVAALTPAEHEVSYIEVAELRSATVFPEFDMVGISSLTAQIHDAYAIADMFRSRGTQVVMGGLHVSQLPDEALAHADAVVRYGAEGAWPRVVEDAARCRLQPIYEGARNEVFGPEFYATPRFDLLAGRQYNRVTVQTSRGCPRACEFCAASLRITSRFNQKPVGKVVSEIRAAKRHVRRPYFEFADDNTFLNHQWSKEFLSALRDEEIHYFTETDVSVADDLELCDLLAQSGCRQVLIGFESPRGDDLHGIDPASWKSRKAFQYRRVIDVLQSRGVSVNGCFIVGLDSHTPDIFPLLLDFGRDSGLAEVQYAVMTPFPGTPLFERLRREGRLLRETFWDSCTLFDVNFRPKHMTVAELEEGLRWLFRETYNRAETTKRLRSFVTASR